MRVRGKKLLVIFFLLLAAQMLLLLRFFQLQLVEGEQWQALARRQHLATEEQLHRRGTIYAEGRSRLHGSRPLALARDLRVYHLHADCRQLPLPLKPLLAKALGSLLAIAPEQQLQLERQLLLDSRNRRLFEALSLQQKQRVDKLWREFSLQYRLSSSALFFLADWHRHYPHGALLGQALQTVQRRREEKTRRAIPLGGIELACDPLLQGACGKQLETRSPRHRFAHEELLLAGHSGEDVVLTIDPVVQAIAEEELARGVQKAGARSGQAIVLEPRSGELLAIAQYPSYSPEDYSLYWNRPELRDRCCLQAVSEAYEPGSTMKPLAMVLALLGNEERRAAGHPPIFDPEAPLPCHSTSFPGRSKLVTDVRLHRRLNMDMALQRSSNVYMAKVIYALISELGSDWYSQRLRDLFGLGTKTQLGLPGESPGFVPTPGAYYETGRPEWSAAAPYSLAMGYNLQATSLQLVRAYGVLANGGYLVAPKLWRDATQLPPRKVCSERVTKRILQAMRYSSKPGGSARKADVAGYTEAVKSGTSEKIVAGSYSKKLNRSSTIGIVPLSRPSLVLFVLLDEPSSGFIPGYGTNQLGGCCAAPIFREIARRTLAHLGVPPDDLAGYPVGDPRRDPKKADWLTEAAELQRQYEQWNQAP